ncbi:MAG: FtsX-like permease family protein [Oscillospiraceae bacterium]
MRKVSFYPKLAFSNLWRNKSTYLPYLLACVVSIITFYTLMAINFNPQLAQLRGGEIVVAFTAVGTVIMAIFCAVLIFYTNSFLIKRRKKEIGLYSVLGMQKSNIAALMFYETVFIALLALVAGLVLGAVLSHFMYLALMALVRFPVSFAIGISWQGAFYTALYFGCIFLLTLLFNLRQVRIASPLQLLAGAKEGEKEPKASWLLTLFGLITLLAGYGIALYVQSPLEALMLFLVAVFLVIVGTFCLFTSGSIALLKILRRNKGYYYTPRHFISVSGMIYRMKQNAAGLASICILSCMVLVTVSSTVSLYVGAEDALTSQYPHEFEAEATNAQDGEIALRGIQAVAEENGIEIQNMRSVRSYTLTARRKAEGQYGTLTNDNANFNDMVYFEAIPLEDYNAAERKNETLQPGEALLFSNKGYNPDVLLQINGLSTRFALSMNTMAPGRGRAACWQTCCWCCQARRR